MPRLSMVPTLLREQVCQRTLPREPEPDLVMDDDEQVQAYAEAGRIDGVMAAAYLFHSAKISQVIAGCRTIVDLGCGPATQLTQVAQLNPDISFTGVDLSATMLSNAEQYVNQCGANNVQFIQSDITQLDAIADHSVDAIISTMALHHLPTEQHLKACFEQIQRKLVPNGAVYIVDFGRLKSLKSVIFFAYLNRQHQPHLFSLDYERSLRAAFLKTQFTEIATQYLPQSQVFSTAGIPILTVIKTPDKPLSENVREKIYSLKKNLTSRYRAELNDIRMLFRLGGMRNDPL